MSDPFVEAQQRVLGYECEACMETLCSVCGHERCPACVDDCDHPDCIAWDLKKGTGKKKHVCIFPRCEQHATEAT